MVIYKKLLANFSSLTLIQIYNLLLPFLVYPYLIKVSGVESYGELVLYQSYSMFMVVIVSYGFDISGVNLIVSCDTKNRIEKLSIVLQSKAILGFFSVAIFFALFAFGFFHNKYLTIAYGLVILSEILNLSWFYLAVEKIKENLFVNVIIKSVTTGIIFLLVNSSEDLWLYPLCIAISNIICGVVLLCYACKICDGNLTLNRFSLCIEIIRESFFFFTSRIMVVIRERLAGILIGTNLGVSELAFYDLCQKVINLLLTPIGILNQAIYPYVSKTNNFSLVRKAIVLSLIYVCISLLFLVFTSKHIIEFLIGEITYTDKSGVLLLLQTSLFFQVFIYFLGNTYLVIKGQKKAFSDSVLYSTVGYILYLMFFIYINKFNIEIVIIGLLFCYFITALHRIYISLRIFNGKV